MKKKLLLNYLLLLYSPVLFSQGLTQSAEGKSSLFIDGSALSLDIAQSELAFGWNNLNKVVVRKDSAWFAGGEIRVKNAKGISTLLSKGSFTPEGRINGYLGHYWSNATQIKIRDKNVLPATPRRSLEEKKQLMINQYYDSLVMFLDNFSELIPNETTRSKEVNAVKNRFDDVIRRQGQVLLWFHTKPSVGINENESGISDEVKNFRTQVKAALARVYANLNVQSLQDLRRKTFTNRKQSLNSNYWRVLLFGFGGANAIGFTRFIGLNSTDLANSFEDINDWGGQGGLGFNSEWRRWRLGLTYAWAFKNNFKRLSATTYTLSTLNTAGTSSLRAEEEITAYSGSYGSAVQDECNVDIVYNLPLDEKRTSHLLLNPYLRGNWQSRNSALLINTTNVGLGFHFFKNDGNFLGGFYVELPDVNNNLEKQKAPSIQNLRPAFSRLTIGITGKFGLNSVLTW